MSKSGQISLQITQSIYSARVLLMFRDKLGGGVSKKASGTGKTRAMLRWQVFGSKIQRVAALLAQIPSMKQAQLKIAAGGKIARPSRERIREQLFQLKQKDHIVKKLKSSWSYFAGFFDAKGSVTAKALSVALELQVTQLNPFVLERLLGFLHDSRLDAWRLRRVGNCATLSCTDLATSKQTLKRLLDHGLLVKQKQAKFALSLNAANHKKIREAIIELNGWQKKYNRLDEEGVRRAKELKSLQAKMRTSSCTKEQELLQDTIQVLREEHDFQKLVSKYHLMRKDIRKMLSEGAFVTPPWCQSLLRLNSIVPQLCQSAPSGFIPIGCWVLIQFQTVTVDPDDGRWWRTIFRFLFWKKRCEGYFLVNIHLPCAFPNPSGRLVDWTTEGIKVPSLQPALDAGQSHSLGKFQGQGHKSRVSQHVWR